MTIEQLERIVKNGFFDTFIWNKSSPVVYRVVSFNTKELKMYVEARGLGPTRTEINEENCHEFGTVNDITHPEAYAALMFSIDAVDELANRLRRI